MQFVDELSGFDDIARLLGRVVMLTMPIRNEMTGRLSHCLGVVTIRGDSAGMVAAVQRDAAIAVYGGKE